MFFIGDLIKKRRQELNISQQQLGDLIYRSKSQISKIEHGGSGLNHQTLLLISQHLNLDFIKINMYSHMFDSYEEYQIYFKLKTLITNCNVIEIKNFLHEMNITQEYIDSLNPSEYYYSLAYAHAIVLTDEAPEKSLDYCCSILKIDQTNIINRQLDFILFDNQFALLIVLYVNIANTGDSKLALDLYEKLYNHIFENVVNRSFFIEQSQFFKKLYIVLLNNYADLLFVNNQYQKSLEICDSGISESLKLDISSYLKYMYKLKVENYCNLSDLEAAKLSLSALKALCDISQSSYYTDLEPVLSERYPALFTDH